MKKIIFLIIPLLLVFYGCQKNTDSKEEVIIEEELTKEEQLKKLYVESVIPLFENFKEVDIPTEFKIDIKDNSINAGASFGYVEVSQGLINNEKKQLQIFVLSHEVAHIVTINQASIFDLGDQIPDGAITNPYKKSEYLADLMAVHLIYKNLEPELKLLVSDFNNLTNLLGSSTFTHPSGVKRVALMLEYINGCKKTNADEMFKQLFKQIWEMN
jgi:Zn-dependent peptidase ImmA (M78 family)